MPLPWLKDKRALTDDEAKIVRSMLRDLLEHYGAELNLGAVKLKTEVAERLAKAINRPEPWQHRYLTSVLSANPEKPSQELARAVYALGAAIDGVPQEITQTIDVMVRALPGAVQPGAIIQGHSIRCSYPPCPVVFVPRYASQLYCCSECGKLHYNWKRREARRNGQ